MIKCTLCGFDFSIAEAQSACSRCFIHKDCNLIRCPQCHYEMVPSAREMIVPDIKPLTGLELGRKAHVHHLDSRDRLIMRKFIAMGLLPGEQVCLVQRYPSFVLEMSRDRFAIDEGLASLVHVIEEKA